MLQISPPPIQPGAMQRVRCRPIAESDFAALSNLLARGFPRSNRDYWTRGISVKVERNSKRIFQACYLNLN